MIFNTRDRYDIDAVLEMLNSCPYEYNKCMIFNKFV